jgi:hypothetical protein
MECRRVYFKMVRKLLRAREFYTEMQIKQAAARGELRPAHQKAWQAWEEMQPTFKPSFKALWLSPHAINWCIAWGQRAPGIIWVDHIAFGVELEKRSGWRFFQGGGKDRHGKHIDKLYDYKRGEFARETVIVSRHANSTGRNLQAWNRALFAAFPSCNRDAEQAVGRLHRELQRRSVHIDVLIACTEHLDSVASVLQDAERQTESLMPQKVTNFPWYELAEPPKGIAFS